MKKGILIYFLFLMIVNTLVAIPPDKSIKINGVVKSETGETLIGVNIQELGTNNATITNINGEYSLYNVSANNSKLKFTYVGYKPYEVIVGNQVKIDVVLKEDVQGVEEVVVVGYASQKRESVIGAIATIKPSLLQSTQSPSITNSLAGQIAGVIAVQRSGEPGFESSDFWIRGISTFGAKATPLVLVDGIERDLNSVVPEEIASFSILKDASATAVYGVRGANGVIMVQTKKGQIGKPRITVRGEYGITQPLSFPKFVDGAKYMEVVNDARILSGQNAIYTPLQIERTRNYYDPDLYPDVNWIDAVTKDFASNQRMSLDISGGSELLRYSLIMAYHNELGIIETDPTVNWNSDMSFQKFNVRSNVDINISPSTLFTLSVGGIIGNRNGSASSTDWIFDRAFLETPIAHPTRYSSGEIPRINARENPWALATQRGFAKQYQSNVQSLFSIEQDFGKMYKPLEGWKAKLVFSFDSWNWNDVIRQKNPSYYIAYGRDEDGDLLFSHVEEGQEFLSYAKNAGGNRTMYFEGQTSYSKHFKKNTIDALMLYNMRDYVDADATTAMASLPYRNTGIAGRLAYNYDDRFFGELNFGYNGSENFKKGYRFGFFPAVALGWMVSNEKFMQKTSSLISKLKVRGSYGKVGNDVLGGRRFAYVSTISNRAGYQYGYDGKYGFAGLQEGDFGIPNLTWETSTKTNLGLELGLLKDINIQVDIFQELRENIFMLRNTIPETAGYTVAPWANFGKVLNKGLEISTEYNGKITKDLLISLRGNFTYAHNTILEIDEPASVKGTNRSSTGISSHTDFGLIAERLFTDDDFSDPVSGVLKTTIPAHTFGKVHPGDIMYKDVNKDDRVDDLDQVPLGNPIIPRIVYGFGLSVKYKQFDISGFFQGVAETNFMLGNIDSFIPGSGGGAIGNIYSNVDDRWTPENPSQDVFWPRLSSSKSENNSRYSSWWQRDGSFLRLKNAEIGYTFPKTLQKLLLMRQARIFARGTNLLTWSPFKMWDPEILSGNGLRYPTNRVVSLGVEIGL